MNLFDATRFVQEIYPLSTAAAEPDLRCHVVGGMRSLGGFHWAQTINSGVVCTHILKGTGTMIKNGRESACDAGMTSFSAAGDHIEYFDSPEHPWRYVWTHMVGKKAADVWRQVSGGADLTPRRLVRGAGLASLLKEAIRKARRDDYGGCYGVSLAWGLMEQLEVDLKGAPGGAGLSLADACAAYIDGHLSNAPTVEELAERFKVSRVTIFREFRRSHGLSPKEYIEDVRFRKAARLLEGTRLGVKEVAQQCGFKDQTHFCCQFKRRFGAPPGRWRADRAVAVDHPES